MSRKKVTWWKILLLIYGAGGLLIFLATALFWHGKGDAAPEHWDARPFYDPFASDMILVEGGSFEMGNSDGESSEHPVHPVTVATFQMASTKVTQAQWRAVMGTDPSYFKNCDNCPVEQVSWDDVQAFLKKLDSLTQQHYRLPTEAEWEYAAKGGLHHSPYIYAGGEVLDSLAWYEANSDKKTHPVKTKAPNQLGLYDMNGNVFEWCQDAWHDDYQGAPANGHAWDGGSQRVYRGGSWFHANWHCRNSCRRGSERDAVLNYVGFRLASSLD